MESTKITLISGMTYRIMSSPEDVYQRITHSDGTPKSHIHLFEQENGHKLYINATYILSIEAIKSPFIKENEDIEDEAIDTETESDRINNNLEAARGFKEDLDGNME